MVFALNQHHCICSRCALSLIVNLGCGWAVANWVWLQRTCAEYLVSCSFLVWLRISRTPSQPACKVWLWSGGEGPPELLQHFYCYFQDPEKERSAPVCVRSLVGLGGGSKPCGKVTGLDTLHRRGLGVMCGCLVEGGGGCLGSQPDRRL